MLDFQQGLKILIGLGLTSRQSKIYLATLQLEKATAKAIAGISGVRRENVYRIIPKLQKIGLIEEIITHPVHFKAVPIKDAVHILLNRRKKYTSELEQSAKNFIRLMKEKSTKEFVYEENGQFLLIPGKRALIQKKFKAIKNTQISLDIVTNYLRYFHGSSIYFEMFREALNRGVQIRVAIQAPKYSSESLSLSMENRIIKELEKNPSFEIRCSPSLITTIIGIFDNKEVCIITSPYLKIEDSPALWTNHNSLVELAQSYFETIWNKSLELQIEKPYSRKS